MTILKIEHDAWIVVADGEKALFLRNEGDATYPNLQVFRQMHDDNPATRDQGTDRPGRMPNIGGNHRSAVEETDWHRIEKERFATEIADRLYKLAHRDQFKKLIVVAPPAVLGDMRKEFHKEVSDRIIAEVPKTLTNHPVDQIEKHLLAA
ncbi:MAG: host attachment protein [Rhizobiaceae bacterium]|nr:host attachment protein [Rhizobiaceae bacterium]